MKRLLILALTVIMLVSALCVPSFAVISELPFVSVDESVRYEHHDCAVASPLVSESFPEMDIYNSYAIMVASEDCTHDNYSSDMYSDDEFHSDGWYCIDCGYSEYTKNSHTYVNGRCSVCGHSCGHSQKDDSGNCIYCTPSSSGDCEHFWSEGYCEDCGAQCPHDERKSADSFDDETHSITELCAVCGMTMNDNYGEHSYSEGVCSECGYICKHTSLNGGSGACSSCGLAIDENGEAGCSHPGEFRFWDSYTDDRGYWDGYEICNYCREILSDYVLTPHTYVDGVCSKCYHECTHSQKDDAGNCVYCTPKTECTIHSFAEGMCAVCGYVCEHQSYTSGICNDCGFKLPTDDTFTPPTFSGSAGSSNDSDVSFDKLVGLMGGVAIIVAIVYVVVYIRSAFR